MDLKKFLPKQDAKEKIEHFWALVIEPRWVQAGIWRIQNQKAQVIYSSPQSAWEVDEELVNACDTALSSAIQDYPEEYEEPQKTVFGVSYDWVTGGEIKPEFLEKIKKICKELSLTPVGFVVLPEAISHLIKSEEGTPLNGVILGVYKESAEISLFEMGKLVGTTQVARSVSLVEDVVEGLSRLRSGENLPSRFLVYDGRGGELEEIRQEILKSNWDDLKNIKFLHTPKVETIDARRKVYAVSLAGASELANVTLLENMSNEKIEPEKDESKEEQGKEMEGKAQEVESISPGELGFALEKDVKEEELKRTSEPTQKNTVDKADLDLGTEQMLEYEPEPETHLTVEETESNVGPAPSDVFGKKGAGLVRKFALPQFAGIKTGLLKTLSLPRKIKFGQSPIFLFMGFLIIFFGALLAGWWFLPKADVTIYIAPQSLEETVDVAVDTSRGDSDFSERVLAADVQRASVSGERTKDTTGTKTVGDKASGEVTIYRVGPELTLSTGTFINGPESLKFALDNLVTVASGSASTPGETTVKVSAENIGAQYNLASGTTFTIGNYSSSDMEAKNSSAFSGGTSREISAVSQKDVDSLQEDLTNELENEATNKLTAGLDSSQYLISGSQTVTNSDVEFNHKVGDEADTLKLSLTLDVEEYSVKKSDLENLANEVLKEKIPQGFVLRGEQISYSFERENAEDNSKFKLKILANLLPEVNTDEIAQKIAGRNVSIAQQYLEKEVPGYVRAEINIKPTIPDKFKTLPHVVKNITVQLSADKQ
jgi:hypothetical protein